MTDKKVIPFKVAGKPAAPKAGRSSVDWERVGLQFRAGLLSLREIASQNGVSAPAILKHAKKEGWERDLSAKIKAKAEAVVNRAVVNTEVNNAARVSEKETIEANATAIANVRLAHRGDIRMARELAVGLVRELQQMTADPDLFVNLASVIESGDQKKIMEAIQRVVSLPGRVSTIKSLSEALKNLLTLERLAWGLDEPDTGKNEGQVLSDTERASRLMTLMDRARRAAATHEAGLGTAAAA